MTLEHHESISADALRDAKTILLDRLVERAYPERVPGYLSKTYKLLWDCLSYTLKEHNNNSVLLMGINGSGKTMILTKVLEELRIGLSTLDRTEYPLKNGPSSDRTDEQPFKQVYLNGTVHTDERLALQDIAKQLGLEHLLEHKQLGSFAEKLAVLVKGLSTKQNVTTIPMVIILDEFDLFALHHKQTLLYNLFDTVQTSSVPIALVGLTCRLDTVELLEKRVKSRFSHRKIHFLRPPRLSDYVECIENMLLLPQHFEHTSYASVYHRHLQTLLQDPMFIKVAQRVFDLSKDVRMMNRICYPAVVSLSPESPFLSNTLIYSCYLHHMMDSKTELLKGVSLLELCLIVAMKRLTEKEYALFNFEMIYEEYKEFASKTMNQLVEFYSKPVSLKAFENLASLEIIVPVEHHHSKGFTHGSKAISISANRFTLKEYQMYRSTLEPAQIVDSLLKYRDCPTIIKKWGTKWLE